MHEAVYYIGRILPENETRTKNININLCFEFYFHASALEFCYAKRKDAWSTAILLME